MKPKFSLPDQVWAGTEDSYLTAQQVYESSMLQAFSSPGQQQQDPEDQSHLLSVHGNVGVVSIKGSLTNSDSPWYRYVPNAVTSYAEIRRAFVQAAHNPDVKAILMDISSGGGAVAGLADVSSLIAEAGKLKDVYAFTDSIMASAAYWLGSTAGQVFLGETALMGSIGVITTHMEYSKQLKEAGIGVTVIRAGKYKALASQVEPLSNTALEQIQGQLDNAYRVFVNHVAAQRGVSFDTADTTMAQGREFFGANAVKVNLADGIATFDRLMSRIQMKTMEST